MAYEGIARGCEGQVLHLIVVTRVIRKKALQILQKRVQIHSFYR